MKQIDTKKLSGKIIVKTGLHIGAGNDKVEIGWRHLYFISVWN